MASDVVSFFTKPDDRVVLIKKVFGTDFNIRILNDDLHAYQGSERFTVIEKCKEAATKDIQCPIVTDVTSVCFNALGGLPGVLISSFVEKLTSEELYRLLDGFSDKSAYVMYSVALLEDEGAEIQVFQGVLPGVIVRPVDPKAYGWEACFKPDGYSMPYCDLPYHVQLEISERKKPLRALKTYLISNEFLSFQ